VVKVENLIALYNIGHAAGQVKGIALHPAATPYSVLSACAMLRVELEHLLAEEVLPFEQSRNPAQRLITAIDVIGEECKQGRSNSPLAGTPMNFELVGTITELEISMNQEMNKMPIYFVTKRRAYSVDALINNAEQVFGVAEVALLNKRTLTDIRQAGRSIAFDLPTAVGFHSVRAVEAVARGYHTIVVGTTLPDGTPLGPLIQALQNKRNALLASKTIDSEDLLNLAIDFLSRIKNVYRNPISHPDMTLEPPQAMNVFESAKCAIALMLEDAPKKSSVPIPAGFF